MLEKLLDKPESPFIAIMGGAKLSDKLSTIQNLLPKVDKILIGGGMTYPFLKAQGYEIGKSICSAQDVTIAASILKVAKDKIQLPIDCALTYNFSDQEPMYKNINEIEPEMMGMDIGPKTVALYQTLLQNVKTIV
jgi:phosphoglycerate kinase